MSSESKQQQQQMNKILKEKNSKENDLQSANKTIVKLRQGSDEIDLIYKQELDKLNSVYKDLEPKYQRIKSKIQDLEESKVTQTSNILSMFFNLGGDLHNLGVDCFSLSHKIAAEVDPNSAIKTIRQMHKMFYTKDSNPLSNIIKKDNMIENNLNSPNIRLPEEEYYNFDLFKRNFDTIRFYNELYIGKKNSPESQDNQDFTIIDYYGGNSNLSSYKNSVPGSGAFFDEDLPLNYSKVELSSNQRIEILDQLFTNDKVNDVLEVMKLMDIIHSEAENRKSGQEGNNNSNKNSITKMDIIHSEAENRNSGQEGNNNSNKNSNNKDKKEPKSGVIINNTGLKLVDVVIAQITSQSSYKVNNYQNFHHLGNLINNIIRSEKSCYRVFELLKLGSVVYFDLKESNSVSLESVLYLTKGVTGKTKTNNSENNIPSSDNNPNRTYLCVLLRGNKLFLDKKSFPLLLYKVINSRLSLSIKELIESERIHSNYFENFNHASSKAVFFKNTYRDNKQIEESIKLGKFVEDKRQEEVFNVLKDFIRFIGFYEVDTSETYTLVSEICKQEVLDNGNADYLITCLNSNLYSVKMQKNELINEKRLELLSKERKNVFEKSMKQIISNLPSSNNSNNKGNAFLNEALSLASILSSVSFLDSKDYASLCLVNKPLYNNLSLERLKNGLKYGKSDVNSVFKSKSKSLGKHASIYSHCAIVEGRKRVQIWKYIMKGNISLEDLSIKKQYLPPKPRMKRIVNEINIEDSDEINKQEKPDNILYSIIQKGINEDAMKNIVKNNNSSKSTKSQSDRNNKESKEDEVKRLEESPGIHVKASPSQEKKVKKVEDIIYIKENYFSSGYELDFSNKSYYEILKVVNAEAALQQIYDTIYLDVLRTFYNNPNSEDLRKKLFNILKIIAYVTQVSYCQGMNYVGSFLLFLTNGHEEEAFNLFYLLIQGSEYKLLFEDELNVLKKYFYMYERLTEILLPEVSQAFKNNNIQVSFFSSSWFITLFTSNITDKKSIPALLYHILDDFLINGWRTIFKISICLLKVHEERLIEMRYEEMLQFLLNDIYNCWLFKDEFLEESLCLFNSVCLKRGLIQNLEIEYELKRNADPFS
eukprot:CAMPEP_0170537166 /NCGR_PEP_ID=MMETSP0209-20121228/102554_1 /TAXON_ID=665100 ORGANISM="Litonotus pictus, Strain P1" /NCGR_SAMPLE_ID=MMETSP0209 /ASSEMBLY_ACC=CAM_ASM_000301 /LENGTH=1101 /DNA_ID=CAMNT_0010838621 /DNA_START=386 /DNA_END=3688 /DNA_ORIENTATION=+